MKTMSLLLFLILLAPLAFTQDVPSAPEPKENLTLSERPTPGFFRRSNVISLSTLAALDAADAYTTVTLRDRGYGEANPIARPFVKSRTGTAVYFATSYVATICEMKLAQHLERTHPRHAKFFSRVQHLILWTQIADETYSVARNSVILANDQPQSPSLPPSPPQNCGPSACITVPR